MQKSKIELEYLPQLLSPFVSLVRLFKGHKKSFRGDWKIGGFQGKKEAGP